MQIVKCADGLILAAPNDVPQRMLTCLADAPDRDAHVQMQSVRDEGAGVLLSFAWFGDRALTVDEGEAICRLALVHAAATPLPERWGTRLRRYLEQAVRTFSDEELEGLARVGLASQVAETPTAPAPVEQGVCLGCGEHRELSGPCLCPTCVMGYWIEFVNDETAHPPFA
jgi:hypothetical protein